MREALLVGLGGAVGALARYFVSVAISAALGAAFPFHTLLINVSGSFLMGLVLAAIAKVQALAGYANDVRLFVAVGVLGGFTTFSSFSAETAILWERETHVLSGLYVASSVVLSIGALFAGLGLVRWWVE